MIESACTGNRCIVHSFGWFTPDDILSEITKVSSDPMWKPKESCLMIVTAGERREQNLLEIDKIVRALRDAQPKLVGFVAYGEIAQKNVQEHILINAIYGTRTAGFTRLQDLFDWVEKEGC